MNPYNSNPFENTEARELKNERDANRELANSRNRDNDLNETLRDMFRPFGD
jgi:hypothetical protein